MDSLFATRVVGHMSWLLYREPESLGGGQKNENIPGWFAVRKIKILGYVATR